MVVVFVKFPQEGSGGRYYSLGGGGFTLKEDVDFFSIEVGCKPCIANFSKRECQP